MDIFQSDHYTRPVLPLLCAYISGLILGEAVALPLLVIMLPLFAGLFSICRALVRKQGLRFAPLIVFFSLGVLAIHGSLTRGTRSDNPLFFADMGTLILQGHLDSVPEITHGKQKFILSLRGIGKAPADVKPASGKIRVTLAGNDLELNSGDSIELVGRLKPFRNFYNPFGFDYERFMALQDIWASVYVKPEMIRRVERRKPGAMDRFRGAFEGFLDQVVVSDPVRGVLKALLTGNRTALSPDVRDEFNRTGTAHLLAISGLHVGIVAGLAFALGYLILSHIPVLLWHGKAKAYAGLMALIPVVAYGVLSGMAPSTQRALVMVAAVLLAHSVTADHDIMNSLGIAALAILIISPGALFSVSFQLSFAAVFFIVWGMACVSPDTGRDKPRTSWTQTFTSYALVSVFAYAGTLPLVVSCFNQISLAGLAANVILVPLVGFLVVPLGLVSMIVYPVSTLVSGLLIRLAGFFLEVSLAVIHGFAFLPLSSIKTVSPSIIEMAVYYGLLMAALVYVSAKKRGESGQKRFAGCLAVVLVLALAGDIAYWANRRFFHRDLRVTVLDVGQGTANLVEFPGGSCMLIDGGGFTDNSTFDMGEKVLAPFLWSKKIATVDRVVMSHPESDHMNGLLYILAHFNVREFWFNGQWRSTKSCDRLKALVENGNMTVRSVSDTMDVLDIDGVRIQVLGPRKGPDGAPDINDASVAVKISAGDQSFLFPGDITEKAEHEMVRRLGDTLRSTVLVVPHHGSKTSSSAMFLEKVKPTYAVISAGYRNRFAMPHKAVLKRLGERGIEIYRTDTDGAILMTVDGASLAVTSVLNN